MDKTNIGLVDQSRRLKGVPGRFLQHIAPCEAVQFFVHERSQLLQRCFISFAPVEKQLSNVMRDSWHWRFVVTAGRDSVSRQTWHDADP
jgi:hypothetical protein